MIYADLNPFPLCVLPVETIKKIMAESHIALIKSCVNLSHTEMINNIFFSVVYPKPLPADFISRFIFNRQCARVSCNGYEEIVFPDENGVFVLPNSINGVYTVTYQYHV